MKNIITMLAFGKDITALQLKNQDGQLDALLVITNTMTRIATIGAVAYLIASVALAKLAVVIGAVLIGLFFKKVFEL